MTYTFHLSVQYFLRPDQTQSLEITVQSTNPNVVLDDSDEESQQRGSSPILRGFYATLDETKMMVIVMNGRIVIHRLHIRGTKSTHMQWPTNQKVATLNIICFAWQVE